MRLENKKIVVTAGAQGIGRATAIAFANEGADVLATDINEEKLNELSKEYPNIKIANLDATNKIDVEKFCSSLEFSPPLNYFFCIYDVHVYLYF